MNATVRRDGSVQRQAATNELQSATTTAAVAQEQRADGADPPVAVAAVKQEEERGWERTSAGSGQLPNPDILFKCIDAETAVVVGSAVDEREGRFIGGACPDEASVSTAAAVDALSMGTNPDSSDGDQALQEERSAATSAVHEEDTKREERHKFTSAVENCCDDDDASTAVKSVGITVADNSKGGGEDVDHDQHRSSSTTASPAGMTHQPPQPPSPPGIAAGSRPSTEVLGAEEVRPQLCVPIMGAGDSGCIGMVVVQGFTTGALVGDDNWRDWFMHRMEPLNRGENRNVKRLKLVRPRGLPDIGRLEDVPTGTAAKVVYGSVEKISRKRGMPVYAVR